MVIQEIFLMKLGWKIQAKSSNFVEGNGEGATRFVFFVFERAKSRLNASVTYHVVVTIALWAKFKLTGDATYGNLWEVNSFDNDT